MAAKPKKEITHHFALQCLECETIVMSLQRHSMVYCGCENYVSVDGGFDYFKAGAKDISKIKSLKVKIL